MNDVIDYQKIIEQKTIRTVFQPIISIKNKRLLGVEALSRGIYNNNIVPPLALFSYAKSTGLILQLERICRELSLKSFTSITSDMLLFLNFETSLLDTDIAGSGKILSSVQDAGISPKKIVIEITEDRVSDLTSLKNFISFYRSKGFLIALDDVGAGHSNLNRIASVMPDIVKIDKTNITNIDKNFYQQEIVGAMVNLSHNTGALTVAEGVETIEEAISCLMLGIDYIQGFYFSKPVPCAEINNINLTERLDDTARIFQQHVIMDMNDAKISKNKFAKTLNTSIENLLEYENENIVLNRLIDENSHIECAYLLNENGVQITDTVMNKNCKLRNPALFSPAVAGDSHEMKNYYYYPKLFESEIYISNIYVSGASGSLCKTISSSYTDLNGNKKIICLDIIEN